MELRSPPLGSTCVMLMSACVWADTVLRGLIPTHDACNLTPRVTPARADCGQRGCLITGGGSAVMVPQFGESTLGCGFWLTTELPTTVGLNQIGGFPLPHERNTGAGMFLTGDLETRYSKSTFVRGKKC